MNLKFSKNATKDIEVLMQIEKLIGRIKNIAGIPTTGSLDLFNSGQE